MEELFPSKYFRVLLIRLLMTGISLPWLGSEKMGTQVSAYLHRHAKSLGK